MKDCKKIHPLLSLHLDGSLSPRDAARVEGHLKACADAKRELEGLKRLREIMNVMPEPKIPHDLHQKIMAKVQGHTIPVKIHRPFWVLPAGAMAAAAVVAVFLFIQDPGLLTFNNQKHREFSTGTQGTIAANKPVTQIAENFSAQPKQTAPNGQTASYAPSQPSNAQYGLAKDLKTEAAPVALGPAPRDKAKRAAKKSSKEVVMDETSPQEAKVPVVNNSAGAPSYDLAFGGATTMSEPLEKTKNEVTADYSTSTNLPAAQVQAAAPPAEPAPTAVTSWSGSFNPASSESQELVTDAVAFQKYWQTFQPGKTPPTVDFTTQAVVVLMDQERPTAGYSIHVSDFEDKPDQLVIHYKVEAPAPGSFNAQVLTRPWALQIIPKPTKPVVFQKD